MCETCPCSVTSIPGPAEVAGGVLGAGVGAAMTKTGRRVMFWGFCVPLLPFAVVGVLGWWTIALVAVLATVTAGGALMVRQLHRHALVVAPPSLQQRIALPVRAAQPALPRAMRRSLTRRQRALPAPQKALEGVVLETPAIGWQNVPAAVLRGGSGGKVIR
jgi:hypothetical protein